MEGTPGQLCDKTGVPAVTANFDANRFAMLGDQHNTKYIFISIEIIVTSKG